MTKWLVSRHPGAIKWLESQGIAYDRVVHHLDPALLEEGDFVFGILPINLACQISQGGVRYFHIAMQLPSSMRGVELSASEMKKFGAHLVEYCVIERFGIA